MLSPNLDGHGGNDLITTGPLPGVLTGGNGNDTLVGSNAADVFFGGGGTDTVDYTAKTQGVNVGLGTVADDGTPGENDNVRNDIEVIWGSAFNDTLSAATVSYGVTIEGGKGRDTITGGSGNDLLVGGASTHSDSDTIYGGAGNDTIDGGGGADYLDGGLGIDTAERDDTDTRIAIEILT